MYGSIKEHLQKEIQAIKDNGLYKEERIITSAQGAEITLSTGETVLNFCANNYLGLSSHPEVIQAAKDTMDTHGFGMSSVRFICGTQDIHKELEENMDAELFEQMISNGAFRAQEMWNLVTYVFELLKTREAPARNESTTNIVQELYSIFSTDGVTIATFVPVFLRKAHQKIDEIEKDKQEFLKQFKK